MNHCGFVNGPCPNQKKCVFPRCDIEYSGSRVWAVLRQVVLHDIAAKPQSKPEPKPPAPSLPDDSFD